MDRVPQYDPARVLTYFALVLVAGAVLSLSVIVGWQIYSTGTAETVWVGQLCLVIGWALGKAGDIYNNRFGTTSQSADKDSTIKQQAKTMAVTQDALLDPGLVVTVDPSKRAPGVPPILMDTMNVHAVTANVTEAPQKDAQ